MGKLAVVATIKAVAGKRDEYLKHLRAAHSQRYLATEPWRPETVVATIIRRLRTILQL